MRAGCFGIISPSLPTGFAFGCDEETLLPKQSIFSREESTVYGCSGMWLNAPQAMWSNSPTILPKIKSMLSDHLLFEEISGTLHGFIFNTSTKELLLHVDFARQNPLFYYRSKEVFAFAYSLKKLLSLLKETTFFPEKDEEGAALLITFASIPGEKTLYKDICKLLPGHSIHWSRGQLEVFPRKNLLDIKRDLNDEKQAAELLDQQFQKSISETHDINHSFKGIPTHLLSGGIDSRLVFIATCQKAEKIRSLCFSKQGYLDDQISREIAEDFNSEHHFFDLQKGEYMMNLDSVEEYDGTINYLASAHHRAALSGTPMESLRILASGQLGNEILSEFYKENNSAEQTFGSMITCSDFLPFCLSTIQKVWEQTPDSGIFKLYHRGFLYTNSAAYSTALFGTLFSPFTSKGFVHAALRLSPKLMHQHKIYLHWLNYYYPEAKRYVWERYGARPIDNQILRWAKWKTKFATKLIHPITRYRNASMTPIEDWYRSSAELQEFFKNTFHQYHEVLDFYPRLAPLIKEKYPSMSVLNKASVLTLLVATHYYENS